MLARPLSEVLAGYLEGSRIEFDILVPVPLHPKRLRRRGYNQSALLAENLGQLIGALVAKDVLLQRRNIPSQTQLSGKERRRNVIGAFECRDRKLRGKRVLLIDDVCTTGATLDACAVTLKEAGAAAVWGLTLARESQSY